MEETISIEGLQKLTDEKIELGENLVKKLSTVEYIDGVKKVQRKILQELKFLKKIKAKNTIKIQHLQCSNLTFYNFLVKNIFSCENIKNVEYPLHVSYRNEALKIDIVCDNGTTWIKVIARNSKTINDVVSGRAEYGTKSILDQAEEYITGAEENHCFFRPPKVIFKFSSNISSELVNELKSIGVKVIQPDSEVTETTTENDENILIDKLNNKFKLDDNQIQTLNLDISTLLAYVSSLTNGGGKSRFKEPLLNEQAICEANIQVKKILDKLFLNKKLICCETTINSFKNIIDMMAGPNEKDRANELTKRISILPDVENIDDNLININVSGKIKERSLIIFSFGIYHKAITVTSNEGFIRSAKMQGFDIPAFVHDARMLTEIKEIY